MHLSQHLAKHIRDVFFGGNWTSVNLQEQLSGISWQVATKQVGDANSIAVLSYHIHYFIRVVIDVLEGKGLHGNDKLSFDCPPIQSQEDWEKMLNSIWADVRTFADLVAQQPETIWWEDFSDNKYGNYYRNISGIIEHTHYHLGQIVLLKKMLQ